MMGFIFTKKCWKGAYKKKERVFISEKNEKWKEGEKNREGRGEGRKEKKGAGRGEEGTERETEQVTEMERGKRR